MRHESPIVGAGLLPCLALALGALGLLSDAAALRTRDGGWRRLTGGVGVLLGRQLNHGWLPTAVTAAACATLGLAVVVLKLIVE